MPKIASVALDNTNFSFDKLYDYLIPVEKEKSSFVGCRVVVPFGRANSKRQGVILEIFEGEEEGKKQIISFLDKKQYLSKEMIEIIFFLKNRYFCTYYDALKTVLPKGINYKTDSAYFALEEKANETSSLQGDEKSVFDYLLSKKTFESEKKILKHFSLNSESEVISSLLKKGFIVKDNLVSRNMLDPMQKMLRLCIDEEEFEKVFPTLTAKQKIVAQLLNEVKTASLKEIMYFCAVTKVVPDALVKKGIALYYEQEIFEENTADSDFIKEEIVLSDAQKKAYNSIKNRYFKSDNALCSLLFGITGSGKTQVYLKLIDDVLALGREVIVMVPEISLTPQTVAIFNKRYGNEVCIFHSKLSVGQRMEQWKRVKSKQAKIVVGTRSAVFAPFENLGLIIVDEEQEHTYKSEMSPRYNAIEVAKFRASYNKSLLILASATPSVESFSKAENSKYLLAEIPERYGKAVLPEVITVDLRDEKNALGQTSLISKRLKEELEKNQSNGEQSILLLNRRGYNTFASCADCGEVVTCPNCSISMTYHAANHRLMCHFCGYSTTLNVECSACHGRNITYSGFGTQKIEEELEKAVPDAKILRMDTDSTLSKFSHEKMFSAFSKGDYDILVGTQMVAKGFDFENVTLAAVINADQSLYSYDYRCSENTFDLITQVLGRAGRGSKKGRAVIQTTTPDNPIIKFASAQDYRAFYKTEIAMRQLMIYPPFCDLCLIACISAKETDAANTAKAIFNIIKNYNKGDYADLKIMILGPAPAKVTKANNKYRYRLIIKCKNTKRFREMISKTLMDISKEKEFKKTTVYADINPVDIM